MAKRNHKKSPKKNNSFLRLDSEHRTPISTCHAVHKSAKDYSRENGKKEIREYLKNS